MKRLIASSFFFPAGKLILAVLLCLLPAGPAMSQTDSGAGAEQDWHFIQKLLNDGMADVAAGELEAFARNHPADPRAPVALYQAGQAYESLDQPISAMTAYDRLLEEFPASDAAAGGLMHQGNLHLEAGRMEQARQTFLGVLSSYPASEVLDEARLGLSEALLGQGKDEEAARNLHLLLAGLAQPELAARALFDLGVLAQKAEVDSLAIQKFDAISARYPGQAIGAVGLLRSAEILQQQEATRSARERYLRILQNYPEVYAQTSARLGLAALEEESGKWKEAADLYRQSAEKGGTYAQLKTALLGLSRAELQQDHHREARDAAEIFLEKFPNDPSRDHARLLLVKVQLAQKSEGAQDSLMVLARKASADVGYQAWHMMATAQEQSAQWDEACRSWRQAMERSADSADQARALLAESRIRGRQLNQWSLAADLAAQAESHAEDPVLKAEALLSGVEVLISDQQWELARQWAQRLSEQYPLKPEATRARQHLREMDHRLQSDPYAAALQLAELAKEVELGNFPRMMRAGTILRERLGDPQAALVLFSKARGEASSPSDRARVLYESGLCAESLAYQSGLDGDAPAAQDWMNRARNHYADAAAETAADGASTLAHVGLIRLELALAVDPDQPWRFDAETGLLLAATGDNEDLNLQAPAFKDLVSRLKSILERKPGDSDQAWLLWRIAELDGQSSSKERADLLEGAMDRNVDLPMQSRLRYTLGQILAADDRQDEAARHWNWIVENRPHSELAIACRYSLAEIHRKAGRYSQATALYADFAGAFPGSQRGQRALLLAGDCALFSSQPELAVEKYRQLLDRYPDSVYQDDAQYRLGTALRRMGHREAARGVFRQLAGWEGSDYRGRSLRKLAQMEFDTGNDSLASDYYKQLITVDAELAASTGAVFEIALLSLKAGRFQEAWDWMQRSPSVSDPPVEELQLQVKILAGAGRWNEARSILESLSRGFPQASADVASSTMDLAEALDAAGKNQEAIGMFRQVSAENRDSLLLARAAYGEGLALARSQHFEESLEFFESAVLASPESDWAAQALFKIGGIQSNLGNHEKGRKAFSRLVEDHPQHSLVAEAMKGEARAYRQQNQFDRALEVYHRLLENHPDLEDGQSILSQIAYCHHELGQFEVAISAYRRVMPLLDEEGQGYAQFWIADSLEKLGRLEEAAAAYLRIPYLYSGAGQLPVTAQLKAARVYQRMGKQEAAVRLYERIVQSHGATSQWGAEAARSLKAMEQESREGS